MNFRTDEKQLIFYEKTGCGGNARQKKLLTSEGISFEVKSMLDTKWSKETLNPFFEGLSKEDIINPFAPKIKNKELDISKLSKDEIVELMIAEPILIKRPLIQIGEIRICGFDMDKINSILKTNLDADQKISTCQSSDPCASA